MVKYLKFSMMSLLVVLAVASCSEKDDAGDGNGSNPAAIKLTFEKKANCPESKVLSYAVLDNEIYYLSSSSLLKYSPVGNKWETLTAAPSSGAAIFAFEGEIFCYCIYYKLAMYDRSNNTWIDASEKLCQCNNLSIFECATLCGKLFVCSMGKGYMIFNPDTRLFETINGTALTNTQNKNICEIGDNAYTVSSGVIYQFNTNSFVSSSKLNVRRYDLVCNYGASRMLALKTEGLPYHLSVGIYNPATNECAEDIVYNTGQIPAVGEHLVSVGNRIFIGPVNAAFYELKIK